MSWDEIEFLTALHTYLSASMSEAQVHVVRSFEALGLYNVTPPFVAFKDGKTENVGYDECHIQTTIPFLCVAEVYDELGGQIIGRDPTATFLGVPYYTKLLQGYLTYANLADGMSMTNSRLKGAHWTDMDPSAVFEIDEGSGWHLKIINFKFDVRAL